MELPAELSIHEIHKFLLRNGGKVTNHSLVKHFKPFLTNSNTREAARVTFKEYVNRLAVVKMENNEKFIVLKDEYLQEESTTEPDHKPTQEIKRVKKQDEHKPPPNVMDEIQYRRRPIVVPVLSEELQLSQAPVVEPVEAQNFSFTKGNNESILSDIIENQSQTSIISQKWPVDKKYAEESDETFESNKVEGKEVTSGSLTSLTDNEQKLTVKERMKKFDKTDAAPRNSIGRRLKGGDEDDKTSVASDRSLAWIKAASRGDYAILSKMVAENPKFLTIKTALHWAAKLGNENIVKLIAGSARDLVHVRSGYTPYHLALQQNHVSLGNLLRDVYDADELVKDYSGHTPKYYLKSEEAVVVSDSYRKKKHKKKYSEKDLGFLRIGSLNMRVKKTTEAFSNFLGVGAGKGYKGVPLPRNGSAMEMSHENYSEENISKSWGSADNIRNDKNKVMMPPPLFNKIKRKKKYARPVSSPSPQTRSTPSTPNEVRSVFNEDGISNTTDYSGSDSDTACGFDANWQRK